MVFPDQDSFLIVFWIVKIIYSQTRIVFGLQSRNNKKDTVFKCINEYLYDCGRDLIEKEFCHSHLAALIFILNNK